MARELRFHFLFRGDPTARPAPTVIVTCGGSRSRYGCCMRNYESHTFKRSRSSASAALVLITARKQYQSTIALSTGVAHPWDMDRRQVAFLFAISHGPEV